MLLLASVVFGGAQSDEALGFLPEEEAELLKDRSAAFRSIPKEQRIPFLVREMRRMLSMRRRRLATADPEHLARFLAKEKPVVAEVVLRALPSLLAHSVQAALPGFRETQLRKEPRAEVFSIVRWKLEEELQHSSVSASFQFADLLGLQARELITLSDRMGARLFATALAGLPEDARQHFFEALPPDQKMLAQRACEAAKTRHMQAGDARRFLELYQSTENPSNALRSAGARRILRACLAESVEFASKLARQHEGELGKLLSHWFEEEKDKKIQGDSGRTDIIEQLEFLAKRGFLERPLILPKTREVSKPKAPARERAASAGMGVGSARLAAPSSMQPPRVEKLPKPTPSKIVPSGKERENVSAVSRVASHAHPQPKPKTTDAAAAPSRFGAIGAERSATPRARNVERPATPRAGNVERSSASPLPRARSPERSLPSQSDVTGKAVVARMPTQTPAKGSAAVGKGVVRVPTLQPVPRRRTGEVEAAEKTSHRVRMKPDDKS